LLKQVRHIILGFIDFFHQPFAKWINEQTFRYLACGGTNTVLDIIVYYISFHYIFLEQPFLIAGMAIGPHIAAFMMSFSISFPSGFILSRYIVFPESASTRKRVQILKYALLVAVCILLNYIFLKLFVEVLGFYPTPSKALTTVLVAIFSYFSQRNFTFKAKEQPAMAAVEGN
jgi:putative flippase GtrA